VDQMVTGLGDGAAARTLGPPGPSLAERLKTGRAMRQSARRSSHGAWEPAPDRPDPVEILVESNRDRVPELVPLRYARMLASPFSFLRGSALAMALDLATTASAGPAVQLCGDAHLSNFGIFASPERRLLFDLNDFDETWPGPFEWDLKRLATSAAVLGRTRGLSSTAARRLAVAAARSYRRWAHSYADMTHLEVWYARLDARQLLDLMAPSDRIGVQRTLTKATGRTHHRALAKLTRLEASGHRRIVPDPPLVTRLRPSDAGLLEQLPAMIEQYRHSLQPDRLALFDHYRLVDVARKVVGVGSVGTLCWVLLLEGPNGGPLFLQAKQAGRSALRLAGLAGPDLHDGERVVRGQQRLQAASDILLGWTTAPSSGNSYYLRQLWDAKGSAEVESMSPAALTTYVEACGWALARAHARTGASSAIAGYLGRSDRFDEAIGDFANAYTDQTERDHAALRAAAAGGIIPVSERI